MRDKAFFLYVEDDAFSREVMSLMMESQDIGKLMMFENSADFLQRLKALPQKPDLILLDIHVMPHNGFEMLKMVRTDLEYQKLKVVALTASVMNEEIEQLQRSGFDGAIAKPLNARIFASLLSRILDGQSVWHVS